MAVESKIIVTAEDRTRAAFASIERNTGKTAMAMVKLQGQMLKLAGVGSLIAFMKRGAEATELWRDEMARLDAITEKFFNTAADTGRIDPLIKSVKAGYVVVFGFATLLDNIGLKIGAFGAAATEAAKLNFAGMSKITEMYRRDAMLNTAQFVKLSSEIFDVAPKGFAKQEEAAKKAADAAKRLAEQRLRDRIRMTIENSKAAEDAFRAESEIGEGMTAPGLTLVGEGVYNEARAKEAERMAEQSAKQREHLQKAIENIGQSFMTEQELMIQQYETRQMIIDDAYMRELISGEEHSRQLEELERHHQAQMGDVHAQGVLERRRFEEMNATQRVKFLADSMMQITANASTQNKAMFRLNQVAGIANAIVSGKTGATKALEWGYPWGPIYAGVIWAAAAANIQAIASAKFGSTSSAPSIGGGGAIPTTPASIPDLSSPAPAPRPTVNVYLQGETEFVSRDWLVNKFVPTWNQALRDGANVNLIVS